MQRPDGRTKTDISQEIQGLLRLLAEATHKAGFIVVGGLIPFKVVKGNKGQDAWEIDAKKESSRFFNIEDAQSARVATGLFAFLIEEMNSEMKEELTAVKAAPKLMN